MAEVGYQNMEGTLWKWTNYFSGWQPRWFVLEQGILSYYRSQDDVNNGCKGSIKMSVCDVHVHPSDTHRLDLVIPGEAHFYVRAATPQERQQWLVVLGSCKACLSNGNTGPDKSIVEEISVEELRSKKSELRLYCDLLMQQVASVKAAVTQPEVPDTKRLDEATSLLSATCDTFLSTLEECLQLTQGGSQPTSPAPSSDTAIPLSPSRRHRFGSRSASIDGSAVVPPLRHIRSSRSSTNKSGLTRLRTTSDSSEVSVIEALASNHSSKSNPVAMPSSKINIPEDVEIVRCPTFFTQLDTSFQDLRLVGDGGIPVGPFLEACKPVLLIFDKLNATAFAPVKQDISGNIKKIQQKHSTNTEKFVSLQDMILYEIDHRQNQHMQSATTALLWLKRSLEFVREFLYEIMTSQEDLEVAANTAYSRALRRYHSLVVRGVYAMAVKAVPTRREFLSQFSGDTIEEETFEKSLLLDMEDYITAMDVVLLILNDFYQSKGIDSDEQV